MIKISIPCQIYGKDLHLERSEYHVISSAPLIRPYLAKINRELSFQWHSIASRGKCTYPPVWYFLPVDAEHGLLCLFEDAGADPRPHVLRRSVGLCTRLEHSNFLALMAAGKRVTHEPSSTGEAWMLSVDSTDKNTTFEWKEKFLDKGDTNTYSPVRNPHLQH